MTSRYWSLLLLALVSSARGEERPDSLLADFEGKDYGTWKTTGDAFGPGPARGTLPNQMPVSGYLGKGLVNSYVGGDKSVGTLTSPEFKIERKYLNFLIGGGKHPDKTCINLLIGGKVVRTATGPNDRPGGSERLDWHAWEVDEFAGKNAVIQIVDDHREGWGHINVDHIIQSDRKRENVRAVHEVTIANRYLHLPVKTGAQVRRMRFLVGDSVVREFEIELADAEPDFWAFSDVSAFKGKKLRIEVIIPSDSKALTTITQSDEVKGAEKLYQEKYRPQFHFTSRRGWLNDPNGLVYFKGEYHLYYQHNPFGWNWGNMHWGHAVSKDLVRWQELPIAIYPHRFGDWAFSGSALVDHDNTSGFKKGDEPPLIAAYTSTGRGECIAYSNDRGRSWIDYEGNPVVKHAGRDPKVIWYAPAKKWVMAVYDEFENKRWIAFYTSSDLKKWEFQSRIEGFYECPDLFELPVDGKKTETKWVLYGADGKYVLGAFDGKKFTPNGDRQQLWYGNFYAAQTFSDTPDRRIQIGWGNGITFPGMAFNQQMTFPCELTLRKTTEGIRMFAEPVREIANLHGKKHTWKDHVLKPGENLLANVKGDLFEITAEFNVGQEPSFGFNVRGVAVTYDTKKEQLVCAGRTASLKAKDGKVRMRLLVDRGSIEVFGNDGQVAISAGVRFDEKKGLETFVQERYGALRLLEVIELKSAW